MPLASLPTPQLFSQQWKERGLGLLAITKPVSCLPKCFSGRRCSGPGWPAGGSAEAIPGSGSAQEPALGEDGWASAARSYSACAFLGRPTLRWQQGWLLGHATHTYQGPGIESRLCCCHLETLLIAGQKPCIFILHQAPKLWCGGRAHIAWGSSPLLFPRNVLHPALC